MGKRREFKKLTSSVLVLFLLITSIAVVSANNFKSVNENDKYCKETMKSYKNIEGYKYDGFKQVIEGLVKDKSISKETGESVIKFIEKRKETLKKMTKVERQKYFKNKTKGYDIIKELVDEKIISQDEGEIIRKKVIEVREAKYNKFLDSLVSEGIIDSSQLAEMKIYFKELRNQRIKTYEKLKNMTVEERKEYFKGNKKSRINPLDDMVSKGIISKEQRDKIVERFKKEYKNYSRKNDSEEEFLIFKKLKNK